MLDFSVLEPYIPLLATAVWITLKFTFFSTIMGFFGGFILARRFIFLSSAVRRF